MATYLANDSYSAKLRSTWIASPAASTIAVDAIPTNVPTIVTVGYGTDYETIFTVTATSGTDSSNYALTGVARVSGANTNIPSNTAVNCLNNAEFFNQYATTSVQIDSVQTLTNKTISGGLVNARSKKRVDSQATTDTITPEISTYDIFIRTAQAHALVINNHSTSTPNDGDMMEFIILGDATPRAITYGDKYVAKSGVALPSTTVASKCTKLLFQWRASLSQWDLLTAPQES